MVRTFARCEQKNEMRKKLTEVKQKKANAVALVANSVYEGTWCTYSFSTEINKY